MHVTEENCSCSGNGTWPWHLFSAVDVHTHILWLPKEICPTQLGEVVIAEIREVLRRSSYCLPQEGNNKEQCVYLKESGVCYSSLYRWQMQVSDSWVIVGQVLPLLPDTMGLYMTGQVSFRSGDMDGQDSLLPRTCDVWLRHVTCFGNWWHVV